MESINLAEGYDVGFLVAIFHDDRDAFHTPLYMSSTNLKLINPLC